MNLTGAGLAGPMQQWTFLWPPRAEAAVPPSMLPFYEKRRWVGQVKKNGSCCIVSVPPSGPVLLHQRTGEPFAAYRPEHDMLLPFTAQMRPGWHVFVAELLHMKTPHLKHRLYLYECLVWRGEALTGSTYRERWDLMAQLLDWQDWEPSHLSATPHIWLAKCIDVGLQNAFNGLTAPEDEGLVLRDPQATLAPCLRQKSNVSWMAKCRRQASNYGF